MRTLDMKGRPTEISFLIDKLTNSIEEVATGKSFATEVVLISTDEIRNVHKKDGWRFNWKQEGKEPEHAVYKLILAGGNRIEGLISVQPVHGQLYIKMHLIENAPHNFGKEKEFLGVAGNMVAFCCKMSFDLGFDGFVAFTAKTQLIDHYVNTLGAQHLYGQRMVISTESARNLVNLYYKDYFDEEGEILST